MSIDAVCAFEQLYGGRLFLHRNIDTPQDIIFALLDGLGPIRLFGQELRIRVQISHDYPCRIELLAPSGSLLALIVERGDNWLDVWRQLLGSLGAAVEYGIGGERMFNSMTTKYRLMRNSSPTRTRVASLTNEINELKDENELLRQLLTDQLLRK